MRRLLRWTFHRLAAASLLLGVAAAPLWVRSYWVTDCLQDVTSTHLTAILTTRGDFLVHSAAIEPRSGEFFAPEVVATVYRSTHPPEDPAGTLARRPAPDKTPPRAGGGRGAG